MAGVYSLPDAPKVLHLLGMLFDGLDVKAGGTFDQSPVGGSWFGVFIGAAGEPVALCGADAQLAASFGAALSMLPPNAAKEAAKARELSDTMRENLREVMNICTRLVLDGDSPHLKLDQLVHRKSLPAAAATLLDAPKGRREFQLQLPRYGGGVLTILSS
ncbi:MAG TPA: hypothetical protein VME42_03475 [Steroidobacteraceae bacterium]|nr:hypothetical protein [Steroidobacteraceae bacterium]